MEEMYKAGSYTPLSMEEYANAVARSIAYLPKDTVIQRITGDPHPKELIAPMWALKKKDVMTAIHATMKKEGLYQGRFYESR
jgi:radical SAM superfamily enzyme